MLIHKGCPLRPVSMANKPPGVNLNLITSNRTELAIPYAGWRLRKVVFCYQKRMYDQTEQAIPYAGWLLRKVDETSWRLLTVFRGDQTELAIPYAGWRLRKVVVIFWLLLIFKICHRIQTLTGTFWMKSQKKGLLQCDSGEKSVIRILRQQSSQNDQTEQVIPHKG